MITPEPNDELADVEDVTLREITDDTLESILELRVAASQTRYVATNERSLAQALFCKCAWFRAVYVGEKPVGFIMLHDDSAKGEYFLWRLMIDERYQGRGYGRRAVELLCADLRARRDAKSLLTSYLPGTGSAENFYMKLGFKATGTFEAGEPLLKLEL